MFATNAFVENGLQEIRVCVDRESSSGMGEDPKYAEFRAELLKDDSSSHKDWSSVKDACNSKAGEDQNEAEDLLELLKDSSSSMPSIDARARVLLQVLLRRKSEDQIRKQV